MQLKKILAIFLAAALIFSVTTVCAVAETNETLKVGVTAESATPILPLNAPMIVSYGEEVSVKIRVRQNTGVSYLLLETLYDHNALEYVGYESSDLMALIKVGDVVITEKDPQGNDVKKGAIRALFFPSTVNTETGLLITLKFKALDGYCGDTNVSTRLSGNNTNNVFRYDSNKNPVYVPFVGGNCMFTIHDMVKGEGEVTDPTCEDMGYITYVCGNEACGKTVQADHTQPLGHTPGEAKEEKRVESTCAAAGSYDMVTYCTVCEDELSRETNVIEALPHTPKAAVEEKRVEPTCTAKGSYDSVVYCDVCQGEISRESKEIAMLDHTPGEAKEENRVEATCTAKGSYDSVISCTVCQTELSRESKEIAMRDHTPGEAKEENRVEATCTAKGSYDSVISCTVCQTELSRESKEIEMAAHSYGETTVVAPTYGTEGYSVHTCTVCRYEEKFDFVDALANKPGDVDGDGDVDTDDVIQLLLHVSMPDSFQVKVPVDFTQDGSVTTDDVIQLLLHVSMPNSFPLFAEKQEA